MFKFAFGLGLGLLLLASSAAEAAVFRVVVVEASDTEMYVKEVGNVQAAIDRLKVDGKARVMRARFAGKMAGTLVVMIEYKDMAGFAASEAALKADADYNATMRRVGALRKIVSDSLYEEL